MVISKVSLRANELIRASEVLVISPEGKKLGVMPLQEALKKAKEMGLDLVEVAPNAQPPVCRIIDYGKYRYELEQKLKKSKKHQTQIVVKELKLRPKIDRHDLEIKKKHLIKFLERGNKVKLFVWFRGREVVHADLSEKMLYDIAESVKDLAVIESKPNLDGRRLIMVLAPKSSTGRKG